MTDINVKIGTLPDGIAKAGDDQKLFFVGQYPHRHRVLAMSMREAR